MNFNGTVLYAKIRPGLILKLGDTRLSLFDQKGTVKQFVAVLQEVTEVTGRNDLIEKLRRELSYYGPVLHNPLRHI